MVTPRDLGLIADDITGACNLAAVFTKRLSQVDVVINGHSGESTKIRHGKPEVYNTQSRALSASESRKRVAQASVRLDGRPVIFKKIDTAFRGNISIELDALLDSVGRRRVIVSPALPAIGRTTKNGVQLHEGVPIHLTEYAADPINPTLTSNVDEAVGGSRNGLVETRDAETMDDLLKMVDDGLAEGKVIFLGSLGLGHALADRVRPERPSIRKPPGNSTKRSGPIVCICGSTYRRAHGQLESAARAFFGSVHDFDPETMEWHVSPKPEGTEVNDAANAVPEFLRVSKKRLSLDRGEASRLLKRFADAAVERIRRLDPSGIVIIGGDTSYAILKKLGATRLQVRAEYCDVISAGGIRDGYLGGVPISVKGGSVGDEGSAAVMIDAVRSVHGI